MQSSRGFSSEAFLNGLDQAFAFRAGHAVVAVNQLAIAANQVFVKIPFGSLSGILRQLLEKGCGRIACDGCFGEHRKLHAKGAFTKISDVLVVAFFLCEVIGWKAQNNQAFVFVLAVDRFKALVLRCKTTVTGGVDHQDHLATVLTQRLRFLIL